MDFELIGEMTQIETIASGSGVCDRAHLRRYYGLGRWRQLMGIAHVRLMDGTYTWLKFTLRLRVARFMERS